MYKRYNLYWEQHQQKILILLTEVMTLRITSVLENDIELSTTSVEGTTLSKHEAFISDDFKITTKL